MSLAGLFSNDLNEFATQIAWFDGPERRISDTTSFLAFIMAESVPSAFEHAKKLSASRMKISGMP